MALDTDVRDRLALSLDTDDLVTARRLAREVGDCFGVVKVGLELFTAAGPEAVEVFVNDGFRVFLDLKLHDIPNTVRAAARVAGSLGVSYLTIHTASIPDMTKAGVEGLRAGADAAGVEAAPVALGVTILTSEADAPRDLFERRLQVAVDAGCGGVVCAASDLADVKRRAPELVTVVPGIRMPGSSADDQARPATPSAALAAGADLLVIGRTVTGAKDVAEAARTLLAACGSPA